MKNKLIFTSYGLTTKDGQKLIGKELRSYELEDKKIFYFINHIIIRNQYL